MSGESGELPVGVIKENLLVARSDRISQRATREVGVCQTLEGVLKTSFELKPDEKAEVVKFLAEQAR